MAKLDKFKHEEKLTMPSFKTDSCLRTLCNTSQKNIIYRKSNFLQKCFLHYICLCSKSQDNCYLFIGGASNYQSQPVNGLIKIMLQLYTETSN